MSEPSRQASPAQTLSRGISALEVLADADRPLSLSELADRLGLHRSTTYRIVRTLQDHRLITRTHSGELRLGLQLATLAANVSRDLRGMSIGELTRVAEDLQMTAFIATLDAETNEAVTVISVEPPRAAAAIAQRPGTRHGIDRGAPGRAIRQQTTHRSEALRFQTSHDEVIPGLSSIAIPFPVPNEQPSTLAVVYLTRQLDIAAIVARLERARDSILGTAPSVPAGPGCDVA